MNWCRSSSINSIKALFLWGGGSGGGIFHAAYRHQLLRTSSHSEQARWMFWDDRKKQVKNKTETLKLLCV